MATEFHRVHGISERNNIILKCILHRYINSNNFTKVLWPQNSDKTLQHCKGA